MTEFQILCAACAGYVTCKDPLTQENVYEHTGRLATIIGEPLSPSDFYNPDTKKTSPKVIWYGALEDVFSVKHEQVKTDLITIETSLEKGDIIYLPVTETFDSEFRRLTKVEYCIKHGKFVISPDMTTGFNGSLEEGLEFYELCEDISEWIDGRQQFLVNTKGPQASVDQLIFALKEAPNDDYLDDLSRSIEHEDLI